MRLLVDELSTLVRLQRRSSQNAGPGTGSGRRRGPGPGLGSGCLSFSVFVVILLSCNFRMIEICPSFTVEINKERWLLQKSEFIFRN